MRTAPIPPSLATPRSLAIAAPLALCACLLAACTPGRVGEADAGPPPSDAGARADGSSGPDAGDVLDCTAPGACAEPACDGASCDGIGGACADGACIPPAPSTETDCDDGVDDDEDALVDCDDPDCDCGPRLEVGPVRSVTTVGGAADATSSGACPAGEALVGLAGQSGQYLDHLQPICAPLVLAESGFSETVLQIRTGAHHVISADGPSGGTPFEDHCPEDMVLTRLTVRSGSWIDGVTAVCEALFADLREGSWAIYADGGATLPQRGGAGGGDEQTVTCDEGAFTRIDLQYAAYVDRLTMHCHDLEIRDGP